MIKWPLGMKDWLFSCMFYTKLISCRWSNQTLDTHVRFLFKMAFLFSLRISNSRWVLPWVGLYCMKGESRRSIFHWIASQNSTRLCLPFISHQRLGRICLLLAAYLSCISYYRLWIALKDLQFTLFIIFSVKSEFKFSHSLANAPSFLR